MLKIGQKAPAFSLPSTSGKTVSLADFAGQKVVLYFYPRDATPGCTREACDFRDRHAALKKSGTVVLGVSSDSIASHDKFREAQALPFELLSDPGNRTALAYGAFGEKMLYGRKIKGTIRSTFVIDETGKLIAAWSPVRVDGHAQAVLDALEHPPTETASAKPSRKLTPKKAAAKKAPSMKTPSMKATVKKVAQKKPSANSAVAKRSAKKKLSAR